jgi:hypothetical protein
MQLHLDFFAKLIARLLLFTNELQYALEGEDTECSSICGSSVWFESLRYGNAGHAPASRFSLNLETLVSRKVRIFSHWHIWGEHVKRQAMHGCPDQERPCMILNL